MKSNRILQIVLVVLIIVFVIIGASLASSTSSEKTKQTDLNASLAQSKVAYNKAIAQKNTLEASSVTLAKQLADAKTLLANAHFRTASESIEYDRLIYTLAAAANVRVTSLTAAEPSTVTEQNTVYQLTTFTISISGLSPDTIFTKTADDQAYLTGVVNNMLGFVNKMAASPDFDTTTIQSISVTEPPVMSADDVLNLIASINAKITDENKDALQKISDQIQADNADLPQEQIDALIKTATDKFIADALKAKTADQIKILVDQAGIVRGAAVITINVWTSKGA